MQYSKRTYSHAQYMRDIENWLVPYLYHIFSYLFAKRECDLNNDREHIGNMLRSKNDLENYPEYAFKNLCKK